MTMVLARPVGRKGQPKSNGRGRRTPVLPVLSYASASTIGGALAGGLLGGLGRVWKAWAPSPGWTVAVVFTVILAITALFLQWQHRVAPLPERRAQVPRRWTLWHSRVRMAGAFGFVIGAGVFTYLNHATMYILALTAFLSSSPIAGAFIGGVYGAVRGLILFAAWVSARQSIELTELEARRATFSRHLLIPLGVLAAVSSVLSAL